MATAAIERPLTETEYSKRRAALARDLDAAKDTSRKAQLKLIQGDISDEEAEALEAEASRIERRLRGLDQAWSESERIFTEESDAAHRVARSRAVAKVREREAVRLERVREVNDRLANLVPLVDEILALEAATVADLDPFRADLDREAATDLVRAIRSHSREAEVLRCTLSRSGLQLLGVVPSGPLVHHEFDSIAAWRQPIQRHLDLLAGGVDE